mmetsp:Transcript_3872/g.7927  ORF Transcript_3872/g.7927 Transcript_3872/m.7927 type:complete len:88 (+) Transcript_3872:2304-2567(+)
MWCADCFFVICHQPRPVVFLEELEGTPSFECSVLIVSVFTLPRAVANLVELDPAVLVLVVVYVDGCGYRHFFAVATGYRLLAFGQGY